jgi:hypothetical protein
MTSKYTFDDPIDDQEIFGSKSNANVQVPDPKADYISDALFEDINDDDIEECLNFDSDFTGLDQAEMDEYFDSISSNKSSGRFKHDFYVPFPTSTRMSERDLIKDFGLAPEKYWPIGSCFQSSENEMFMSDLIEMGIGMDFGEKSVKKKGSCDLGEMKESYLRYAKHMRTNDSVFGDVGYLLETSRESSPLLDHERNCIDCYKKVTLAISKTRLHSYTLFLRRLAENIMHVSRKIGRRKVGIRTLGDNRIICLQIHSNLATVESGPLCSFIIKMTQEDYDLYSELMTIHILFCNDLGEVYVYVPWRSFDLVDCTIMLRSHYNLSVFPLMFTDSLDDLFQDKVDSCLTLLAGLVQCRNSEVFQVLSCFRYIMPGILNKYHNISKLILDKFPRLIRSGFTDYIIHGLMEWMTTYNDTLVIRDRSRTAGNVSTLDEYDVEFHCKLPYLQFDANNFDQYLTVTYLISMTVGKTKQSRHVQLGLARTLIDWEEKAQFSSENPDQSYFKYSEFFLDKSVQYLSECVKVNDGDI